MLVQNPTSLSVLWSAVTYLNQKGPLEQSLRVSRFGLTVSLRLVSRRTSVRFRLGSPFSSKRLWFVCGHCLVTLSLTITATLKWLSSLPILMQESFWW